MLTPASTSQSRITLNEPDMVLNVRVSACRRPFEPGIRRHTVTVSLPPSSPATRSNMTSIASLPFHPEGGHRLPAPLRRDLCQDTDPRARSNNPVTPETPAPYTCNGLARTSVCRRHRTAPPILISQCSDLEERNRLHLLHRRYVPPP